MCRDKIDRSWISPGIYIFFWHCHPLWDEASLYLLWQHIPNTILCPIPYQKPNSCYISQYHFHVSEKLDLTFFSQEIRCFYFKTCFQTLPSITFCQLSLVKSCHHLSLYVINKSILDNFVLQILSLLYISRNLLVLFWFLPEGAASPQEISTNCHHKLFFTRAVL